MIGGYSFSLVHACIKYFGASVSELILGTNADAIHLGTLVSRSQTLFFAGRLSIRNYKRPAKKRVWLRETMGTCVCVCVCARLRARAPPHMGSNRCQK